MIETYFSIFIVFSVSIVLIQTEPIFSQKPVNLPLEEYDFTDKIVLVTGSSGGLGAQIAREFAKRGAHLVITGRREHAVKNVALECQSLSPISADALPFVVDVTKNDQLGALINATINRFGKLDVLVNNAGGGVFGSIYSEQISQQIHQMMNLNLYSVVTLTHLAVPFLEQTKGNIVTISSILGQQPVNIKNCQFLK